MNKVVSINLNGLVFSIDDTAYEQLKQYLDGLKAHFGTTTGAAEIIQDIEARIAELLQSKLSDRYTVIQVADIAEVIALMGNPLEIDGEEGPQQKQTTSAPRPDFVKQLRRDTQHKTLGGVCAGLANYFGIDIMVPRILFLVAFFTFGSGLLVYLIMWIVIPEASSSETPLAENQQLKRLFRNPLDKKVGGVCSGIAEYLEVDAVWLRLIFLIAFFVFGTGLLAYIILWIAIPEAKTSAEKLQMKGAPIDVSNIEKEVRSSIHKAGKEYNASPISEIVRVVVKIISKLIGFILIMISLTLIGVVLFLWNYSFADILARLDIDSYYSYFQYGFGLFVCSVAALIMIMGIKFMFHTRIKIKVLSLVLFVTSLIGFASMLYFGLQYRQSVLVKRTVKENVLAIHCPDTLFVNVNQLYRDEDSENEMTVRINNHTKSRTFRVGEMKDWVNVFYNTKLSFKPSSNDSLYLYLVKSARGENDAAATTNARDIHFTTSYTNNVLTIDEGISMEAERAFKYQQVSAKFKVPEGTIVKVDRNVMQMLNSNYEEDFDMGETFRMTATGLKCLDCVDTEDETDEDINIDWNIDEDDGEVNIKIRKEEEKKELQLNDSADKKMPVDGNDRK